MEKIKVALADDHVMLRNGLAGLITNLGFDVLFECNNGKELVNKLNKENLPDIILMDINMPVRAHYTTTHTHLVHSLTHELMCSIYASGDERL